jgi:hypothetical protein
MITSSSRTTTYRRNHTDSRIILRFIDKGCRQGLPTKMEMKCSSLALKGPEMKSLLSEDRRRLF